VQIIYCLCPEQDEFGARNYGNGSVKYYYFPEESTYPSHDQSSSNLLAFRLFFPVVGTSRPDWEDDMKKKKSWSPPSDAATKPFPVGDYENIPIDVDLTQIEIRYIGG
jgi:hypothetical protein